MTTGLIAVITGDVVNSSIYTPSEIAKLMQALEEECYDYQVSCEFGELRFSVSRGDSFQGILVSPEHALTVALLLKTFVNAYRSDTQKASNASPKIDVRMAIGVGEASYDLNTIHLSNGPAFQYSGRKLDKMKGKEGRLAFACADSNINNEFEVHLKFLDNITNRWSVASAEVIYYLLKSLKETQIAAKLDRSQAAINHRKQAAGWDEIKTLLKRYAEIIKRHFS